MYIYTHLSVSRGYDLVNDDDERVAGESGVDRSPMAAAAR